MAVVDPDRGAGEQALRIFRRESPVTVLGPGLRAVVWVQGCPFACRGCIVPESWPVEDGIVVPVHELADWVLAQPEIEGVTFSGGEPMEQAGALATLVEAIRAKSDLGVVCYTGYRLETLHRQGTESQRTLLARVDLLIDGVYREDEHADLRWRGSTNQRLVPLTERYRAVVEEIEAGADCSAGMEFFMDDRGAFGFAGVPAQPGFRTDFETRLAALGVRVS